MKNYNKENNATIPTWLIFNFTVGYKTFIFFNSLETKP